ncbi:MAG TPA: TonB-dependent receptor [Sphingomonas sp.]|nr:TonB-dependent receptor [Sphingomonas sp.]
MVRARILLGVSMIVYASAAAAQQAPTAGVPATEQISIETKQGGEIVVTGIRHSLERAAEIKQDAPQVVDSIVSEDIGKFPDPTTAAALQRVPGVQVSVSQSNEIGNVKVRGLGDILTTLDGREIITGTGRTFAMQDLPADALARVDVVKTNTADMIEGGIAGTIDLQLNKPFNFHKPTIVVSARGGYGLKSDRIDPQVDVLATDTWTTGIGDIGVLLNASWAKTHYNHPRTREGVRRSGDTFPPANMPFDIPGALIPNVVESHSNYGEYQRPQANGSIQWRASDHLQIYLDGLYTGYRSKSQWSLANAQLFMPGTSVSDVELTDDCIDARVKPNGQSPLPSTDPYGNSSLPPFEVQTLCAISSATFSNPVSEQKTYAYDDRTDGWLGAFGAKYDTDTAHVAADVSYQRSIYKAMTILAVIGQRIPTFEYTADPNGGAIVTTPGNPFLSSDNLVLSEGFNQDFNKSVGGLFQARLDTSLDIDSSFLSKFQVGVRYADHTAEFNQAVVNTAAPGGVIGTGSEASAIRVDDSGLPDGYLYTMPGVPNFAGATGALVPDPDFLRSLAGRDAIRTLYGLPTGDPAYQPQRRFHADERTLATYVQLGYKLNIAGDIVLDGLVGVRPTRTERTMEGSSVITVPATSTEPKHTEIVPLTSRTTDTDILPNASARLRLDGGLQLRATYAKTIRRPDFGSLNPGLTYALSTNPNLLNTGSAGNPGLLPQRSQSYDASIEYYFRRGFAAVAVYKRDITGRVVSASSIESINGIDYSISRPRNIGAAELKGVEVSGQMFFDFLPGVFSGLGVMGNFTYADSKIQGDDRLAGLPLQGVSKYNFNAGLLFEKSGVSGRLIYTYRSKYYDGDATGGLGIRELVDASRANDPTYNPLLLNYVEPAGRLDFGVSWDVNDRLRFDVGGTNILGNKYRGYYNDPHITQEYRYDDTTYTFGVRVRL